MRVTFLLKGVQPCVERGLQELTARGCELLVVHPAEMTDSEFHAMDFGPGSEAVRWADPPDAGELLARVQEFEPDAIFVQSWDWPPAYRTVMKAKPNGALRVLMLSNFWRNTARQWIGRATHRLHLGPYYDCALVPGDRAEFFANRLGFSPDKILRGMWAADTRMFGTPPRSGEELAGRRRFVTALRLVHHKGADVLAAAYRSYRDQVESPWELHIAGLGPMAGEFDGIDGVKMLGFQQPEALAQLCRESSAFVLPSREEYFGVVVHEAAAAGLPILITHQVGAHPTFVQDGYNGWVVPSGDADLLAAAMVRMSEVPPERLEEMSSISRQLASRLSPEGWARNLHEELSRRVSR